jgi:hypothetical protein
VQAQHRLVALVLDLHAVALELEPEVLGAEQVAQLDSDALGLTLAVAQEELVQLAGEAAREARQPAGVALEDLLVDARPVVIALDIGDRRELEQVLVAALVAREQRQVRVRVVGLVVGLEPALLGDVDLAA